MELPDDPKAPRLSGRRDELDRGAHRCAKAFCQAVPQHDVVAARLKGIEAALHEISGDGRDRRLDLGLDSDDGDAHIATGITDDTLRAQALRHATGHPGSQGGHGGGGIEDAAAILLGPQALELGCGKQILRRLSARRAALVGDLHMGHGVHELGDEILFRALHQRRHGDGKAHPQRDAQNGHDGLAAASGDVDQGELEDQAHVIPSFPSPSPHPSDPPERG